MVEVDAKSKNKIQLTADIAMQPGVYTNLHNQDYHSDPAISRSGIMLFDESPYKYWANYINPNRPPKHSTPAMEFGSAFHTFILEPEKFDQEYVIENELEKSPKRVLLKNVGRPAYEAYKAEKAKVDFINDKAKEDFEEKAEGKIILSLKDWYVLQEMKNAIMNHPEAWPLIEGAIYEQSYFWEECGLMVKARPDILHKNMIVDLKTCVSAETRSFQSVMADSGYHVQGAMIRDAVRACEGRDIPNVINICIEKAYPWEIGIKIISEDALAEGQRKYKEILKEMKEAFDNNHFPSFEVETVELPRWAN